MSPGGAWGPPVVTVVAAFGHERCPGCQLAGDGQPPARPAQAGAWQAAQREAQVVQLFGRGGEQEIALVAVGVGGAVQLGPRGAHVAADVVAGRHRLRTKVAGDIQQVAELHRLIASDAGDRRLTAQVGVGEVLDHLVLEAAFVVEDVVRNVQALGGGARVMDVLARAAGALLLDRRAVIVELQGHAHHVVAGLGQQGGGHGRIHPARHGGHDPAAGGQAHTVPSGGDQAVGQAVGNENRCVHGRLSSGSTPDLRGAGPIARAGG